MLCIEIVSILPIEGVARNSWKLYLSRVYEMEECELSTVVDVWHLLAPVIASLKKPVAPTVRTITELNTIFWVHIIDVIIQLCR